ncbi:MAG: IS3 family transposase [Spirochaetia bacterium]|nr:IS3 family transposase [Spirochaetia bacterium]
MKFGFMYVNRTEFRIDRMAKVLQVSQSGYYKWVRRMEAPLTEKEREDQILKDKIFELFRQSRGSYGSRKITAQINKDSERPINHKRIERIMRENDLFSKTRKKFVCLTDSDHSYPVAENLLARDFNADRPNQKMVSDTTEVSTEEGKLYVAGILDLYGRMPAGFAIGLHNDRYLVMHALEDALTRGCGGKGCLLHSDRGSTYCCDEYQEMLQTNGFVCSMSRKGNCWDNAPMESFWGKMKTEWLKPRYKTRAEAIRDIYEYVWSFYIYQRPHESIHFLTPYQYCRAA